MTHKLLSGTALTTQRAPSGSTLSTSIKVKTGLGVTLGTQIVKAESTIFMTPTVPVFFTSTHILPFYSCLSPRTLV